MHRGRLEPRGGRPRPLRRETGAAVPALEGSVLRLSRIPADRMGRAGLAAPRRVWPLCRPSEDATVAAPASRRPESGPDRARRSYEARGLDRDAARHLQDRLRAAWL